MDYQVKITHNPAGRGCVYFEIPVVEHNPRFRLVFLPVLLSLVNNRVTHDFFSHCRGRGGCLHRRGVVCRHSFKSLSPSLGNPKLPSGNQQAVK